MSLASVLIIVVLVAVTALYVAAEFAAVSVRRSRVRQLAEDGHGSRSACSRSSRTPQARPLHRRLPGRHHARQPDPRRVRPGAIAPGLAPPLAAGPASTPRTAASVAGIRSCSCSRSSTWWRRARAKVARTRVPDADRALHVLADALVALAARPFIWFLNGSGTLILRLLGSAPTAHRHVHSPEEIELLIAESHDGGLLEPDELRRLQRALRFSLRTAAS